MPWLLRHTNVIWPLLFSSIAFNAGFGTTFAVRTYRGYCRDAAASSCGSSLNEQLNLTPAQAVQMAAARENLLRQVAELRRELNTERETLAALLEAREPGRAAVARQVEKTGALQQQIQQRVIEHLLAKKKLLDPAQREAFNEIIRRRVHPCGGRNPQPSSDAAASPEAAPDMSPGRCRGMGGP